MQTMPETLWEFRFSNDQFEALWEPQKPYVRSEVGETSIEDKIHGRFSLLIVALGSRVSEDHARGAVTFIFVSFISTFCSRALFR